LNILLLIKRDKNSSTQPNQHKFSYDFLNIYLVLKIPPENKIKYSTAEKSII